MNENIYVPAPRPAASAYLIGAHYFPGWKYGTHEGWKALGKFPERTPLLGYYDEENPEVTDWEIKWALDHGIQYFVYCWYRKQESLGRPMTDAGHYLGHAIHDGLFHARYGQQMKFAIMWETGNRAAAASEADLYDNLLPYWIDTYFSRPNYLRLGGKPVLYVYWFGSMGKIVDPLGGPAKAPMILQRLRDAAARRGLGGLTIGMEYRGQNPAEYLSMQTWGFDFTFSYCWHTPQRHPTGPEAIDHQLHCLDSLRNSCPLPYSVTASMGWDPAPWASDDPANYCYRPNITQWKLTPAEWKTLLERVKNFMDAHPADAMAQRLLLLDNWNEWSEGHYLSPEVTDGFGYLQAVREVFTRRDNTPDYRLPGELGLGPYDGGYRRANEGGVKV